MLNLLLANYGFAGMIQLDSVVAVVAAAAAVRCYSLPNQVNSVARVI